MVIILQRQQQVTAKQTLHHSFSGKKKRGKFIFKSSHYSRIFLPVLDSLYYEPTPTTDAYITSSAWVPTQTPIEPAISSSSITNTTPTIVPDISSSSESILPTIDSSIAADNHNEEGGGLSDKNKTIIGGVVGGIGGAALLGVLAFVVVTRLRRKRRAHDRESFHPQADDSASLHQSPEMSNNARHDSAEYSYYNTAANQSADRIISPNGTARY